MTNMTVEQQDLELSKSLRRYIKSAIAVALMMTMLNLGILARAYWLTTANYRHGLMTVVRQEGTRLRPIVVGQVHDAAEQLRPVAVAEMERAFQEPRLWKAVDREREALLYSLESQFVEMAEEALVSLADSPRMDDAVKDYAPDKQAKVKEVARAVMRRLGQRLISDQQLAFRINDRLEYFPELSATELRDKSAVSHLGSQLLEQLLWGLARHITDDPDKTNE
ncbi:MAG: hypothetical protein JSS49_02800 [Planctomycetes bacterium]|nr:hypothetical protein [Planctomycetota bacterium]